MQKVVKADLNTGGRSIFPPYIPLARTWELTLDCGHTVTRPCRYPKGSPTRGRGWFKRHIGNDELDPPKRVKCEVCARKASQ